MRIIKKIEFEFQEIDSLPGLCINGTYIHKGTLGTATIHFKNSESVSLHLSNEQIGTEGLLDSFIRLEHCVRALALKEAWNTSNDPQVLHEVPNPHDLRKAHGSIGAIGPIGACAAVGVYTKDLNSPCGTIASIAKLGKSQ